MDLKRWIRANWDRVAAWACVAVGALVLILGWHGVARSAYPAQQMPYIISGGIGGALLVALGATLLISSDLRDEWQKLDRIESRLAESGRAKSGHDESAEASHANGKSPVADSQDDGNDGSPVRVGGTRGPAGRPVEELATKSRCSGGSSWIVSPWSPAEALRRVFLVLAGVAVWVVAWWFSHRQAAFTCSTGGSPWASQVSSSWTGPM